MKDEPEGRAPLPVHPSSFILHPFCSRTPPAGHLSIINWWTTSHPAGNQPMDEHTQAASERVTPLAPPDGALATEQRRVEQLAARLGLDRARLSALSAV